MVNSRTGCSEVHVSRYSYCRKQVTCTIIEIDERGELNVISCQKKYRYNGTVTNKLSNRFTCKKSKYRAKTKQKKTYWTLTT